MGTQTLKAPSTDICIYISFPGGSAVKNPPSKQETQKMWVLIPGSGRSLEEGVSSIVVERIPWTEEPGRLPSNGSQRVGHN